MPAATRATRIRSSQTRANVIPPDDVEPEPDGRVDPAGPENRPAEPAATPRTCRPRRCPGSAAARCARRCWTTDPDMRRRAQVGLNKGEAHHALKRAINFQRGELRDRTEEGQHYRLAGLNLLAAIIIYWNTRKLGEAVFTRKDAGLDVPAEFLAHVSPLGWEHINLTGEYTGGQVPAHVQREDPYRRISPPSANNPYLSNGGTLEHAQQIAGHASPRTTKLYDRTADTVTLDEIERIVI